MVLPDSHGIPRAPRYSGPCPRPAICFRLRDSHPLRYRFPTDSTNKPRNHTRPADLIRTHPTTPHTQPLPGITRTRFSHHPLSLTTTQGITILFSLPTGTEMFHFPASPLTALYIQTAATRHNSGWVPPFGHPRITARLTTPRGLSRPPTSFIGAWCQGIHRMPHSLGHYR